jgi:hypothetical protein
MCCMQLNFCCKTQKFIGDNMLNKCINSLNQYEFLSQYKFFLTLKKIQNVVNRRLLGS